GNGITLVAVERRGICFVVLECSLAGRLVRWRVVCGFLRVREFLCGGRGNWAWQGGCRCHVERALVVSARCHSSRRSESRLVSDLEFLHGCRLQWPCDPLERTHVYTPADDRSRW